MAEKDSRGWIINGDVRVELSKLVELYKKASASGDDSAVTLTAEALAAESTALANPAAEASAFVAAQAIHGLARGK
jgi:hypothetical protein